MSFFELLPEPEDEDFEDPPTPAWAGPANDELGVEIPLHLVLAESDAALIALQSVTAYTNGLVFHIAARAKREPVMSNPFEDDDFMENRFAHHDPRSPKFVRFGLQFSDGSKVTNLMPAPDWWDDEVAQPERPVLIGDPDFDADGSLDIDYWLWPLPPGDSLLTVVEWPAEGIPETLSELQTAPLLSAAAEDTRF